MWKRGRTTNSIESELSVSLDGEELAAEVFRRAKQKTKTTTTTTKNNNNKNNNCNTKRKH